MASHIGAQSHFELSSTKLPTFFWLPERFKLSKDRYDYLGLTKKEQEFFTLNLTGQISLHKAHQESLDSISSDFGDVAQLAEWVSSWRFLGDTHEQAYNYIYSRIAGGNSSKQGKVNKFMTSRSEYVTHYRNELNLILKYMSTKGEGQYSHEGRIIDANPNTIRNTFYLLVCATNALESIQFYSAFACSFVFTHTNLLMRNSAEMNKLIARDINTYKTGSRSALNLWHAHKSEPELRAVPDHVLEQGRMIYLNTVKKERAWANYLFKNVTMLSLGAPLLISYIEYIAGNAMTSAGFDSPYNIKKNPLPWMDKFIEPRSTQFIRPICDRMAKIIAAYNASVMTNVPQHDLFPNTNNWSK